MQVLTSRYVQLTAIIIIIIIIITTTIIIFSIFRMSKRIDPVRVRMLIISHAGES